MAKSKDFIKESEKEPEKAIEVEQPKEKSTSSTYITKYNIDELAAAAKTAFGTDKVIVMAALKDAGKDAYTMKEAEEIVKTFKSKEVK